MDLSSLDHKIDTTRIQMLEEAGVDVSSGLLGNLLQIFYANTLQRLDEMEAHATQGSLSEVARVAHNLKASCGTFGATAMSRIAAEIESSARSNNPTLIPEAIRTLRSLFPGVQEQIEAHLAAPLGPSSTLTIHTDSSDPLHPDARG